ncbi:MAG TPA: aminotransferase class V-fold PLP-dependent enzyme [Devosiaceae bacterium]|jgi:selenocysteine lyase/cysteine desulfurase|nr:aminotransferase class V-fold PLP-dependent enzyme [Devosiaceae bacterium]
MVDRRDLLKWSALAAATAPLLPRPAQAQLSAPGLSLAEWAGVRQQFRLSEDYIHMSAMLLASHPAPVREAIERHREGLDTDTVAYIVENDEKLQTAARTAAGDYLGIHHSHIALTDSTTMGVGIVYGGLLLAPGDEIVTTDQDYYVTHEATRLAAERAGGDVRSIRLFEDLSSVSANQLAETVIAGVGPATRVLALTWVHSSTGLKLPIAAIAARLADINAEREEGREVLLCVDGVHGFGVEDVSFTDLGCDFLMAGCHKWLFGPRGTGIVAASRRGLDSIRAVIPSFLSGRAFNAWIEGREPEGPIDAETITPGGFKAFEHLWSMPEAFAFQAEIGKARVAERTHALASQLKEGLAGAPGVLLRTPRDPGLSAGIVSFDIDGVNPHAVVRSLRQRGLVASVAPYATQHVRLTPSIRNSEEEVDAAVAAVRAVAG